MDIRELVFALSGYKEFAAQSEREIRTLAKNGTRVYSVTAREGRITTIIPHTVAFAVCSHLDAQNGSNPDIEKDAGPHRQEYIKAIAETVNNFTAISHLDNLMAAIKNEGGPIMRDCEL